MTVGEKSTELGYNLGQKILDSGVNIVKETCPLNGFVCFKIEGAIPADENQRGSKENYYYYDSSTLKPQLSEESTREEVIESYLSWISEQPYTEKPEPFIKEEI